MKVKNLIKSVTVALVFLLILTGCAEKVKPQPPVEPVAEEGTITLAAFFDLTGPYAAVSESGWLAIQDCIEYINSQGGIRGHKIELIWEDTHGELPRAIGAFEKQVMHDPKPVAFMTAISQENEALKSRFGEEKVPCMSVGVTPVAITPPGWVFFSLAPYSDGFAGFMKWYLENRWQEKRNLRLAFITWDNAMGKACLNEEALNYVKRLGVDIVVTQFVPLLPQTVATQLASVEKEKADLVWSNMIASPLSIIANEAYRRGLTQKIQFAATYSGMDNVLIKLAPEGSEGYIGLAGYPMWDEDTSQVRAMKSQADKMNRPEAKRTTLYTLLWQNMIILSKGIDNAIGKVGYKNLNGPAVKEGLESIKNFDPMGTGQRVTYGPKERRVTQVRVVQIKSGKIGPVSGWIDCPDVLPKLSP
jgi:branched-chain amino acid transport system substrate-binding protein